MKYPYSILIQWSDEDQKYIASLPEFGPYARTHGETYAEAVEMAEEVLELLIESYQESGKVLPAPRSLDLYAA
jgi:predicted RNase H-like HicB family nuclease